VPAIAEQCPDGSYASPTYVLENGECVLTLICPPCEGPCTSPTPPEPPPPSPPACTAASPNECEMCLALPQICEVCSSGETECAHYVLQNGACAIEICPNPGVVSPPPSPPPEPGPCSQGEPCSLGEGCGTAEPPGFDGCSTTCECTPAGYFECTQACPSIDAGVAPPPDADAGTIPGCSPGDPCMPNSGCGGEPIAGGCIVSCSCGPNYTLECTKDCPNTGVSPPAQ
jgi:hypothetical protein